jgi:hypothetical protein
LPRSDPGLFVCFAGVFRGDFEKVRVRTWFFDGKNVVKCVVIVAKNCHYAAAKNMPLSSTLFLRIPKLGMLV